MSIINTTKTRLALALANAGTALGTCPSYIDTTAWQNMQVMSIHRGSGGSRTVNVFVNAGTQKGTASTTMPDLIFAGSQNSDQSGAGSPIFNVGSLTDQAIITFGTSSDGSFSISYRMFD